MHVVFCHDNYYSQKRDGTVHSYGTFPYETWEKRFLQHFDKVTIIGLKKKVSSKEIGILSVSSGDRVNHVLIPEIKNLATRISRHKLIYNRIYEQIEKADALIVHGSIDIGVIATKIARTKNIPYVVEMNKHTSEEIFNKLHLINKLFIQIKNNEAKAMVYNADAVIYSSKHSLLEKYPTKGITDFDYGVEINKPEDSVLADRINRINSNNSTINIGIAGCFSRGLEGLNIVLDALSIIESRRNNLDKEDAKFPDFKLKIMGNSNTGLWKNKISECGLSDKVEMCGAISGEDKVTEWMDGIDIFLHTNFQDTLPKFLVLAMSRGCPCLSSFSGSVQEILPEGYVHNFGNSSQLAQHIWSLGSATDRMECAKTNFEKAQNYTQEVLIPRRTEFWQRFTQKISNNAA